VVQDGDTVRIDIPNRRLDLEIPDEELQRRLASWTPPPAPSRKGYLSIYSKLATSPDRGAALDYDGTS
jgi:dihydroxy-acid dehydratase